ncbi:MAG: MFS transporter [Candidatus Acidiferrales bacterium]
MKSAEHSPGYLHERHGMAWRALFAERGFRYFFMAMLVSLFGTGLNFAGVTWYILAKTGSTEAVGITVVLLTLPGLAAPLVGGVLIDRLDRRYLGISVDLARGVIVAIVALAIYFGHRGVALLDTMVLLLGAGFATYWPTVNALFQEIVPRERLVAGNAAVLIAVQGGMAIAGTVVGFVYDRAGLPAILAVDAGTYFFSAFCLWRVRRGHVPPRASRELEAEPPLANAEQPLLAPIIEPLARIGVGLRREWREGVAYLRREPRVLALGATYACMMAGVISANVLIVALVRHVLHSGPRGFGAIEAGWAVGAILGGFAVGWLVRAFSRTSILIAALAVLAVGHALFPYARFLIVAAAMYGIFGGCRALGGVLTQSSIMAIVPKELMGRTQSVFSMLATLLQVIMSFLLGWLAERVNLHAAFVALGLLYALAVVAAWRARDAVRSGTAPVS